MSIADKLITIADNTPLVAAAVNEKKPGKNLINVADITEPILCYVLREQNQNAPFYTGFKENTQYTISCEILTNDSQKYGMWEFNYTDGTRSYSPVAGRQVTGFIYATSTAGKTVSNVIFSYASGGFSITAKNFQLVEAMEMENTLDLSKIIGQTISENGGTLTANADGSITGSGTPTGGVQFGFATDLPEGDLILTTLGKFTNMACVIALLDSTGTVLSIYSVHSSVPILRINTADYPTHSRTTVEIKRADNNVAISGTMHIRLYENRFEPYKDPVLYAQALEKAQVIKEEMENLKEDLS